MSPSDHPPIFVINLERSTARRERIRAQAESIGVALTFVKAVDGATLGADALARCDPGASRRHYGRALRPQEIGCYLSHLAVWERIRDGGHHWAVVLEDDGRLEQAFVPALRAIAQVKAPWDLIRLAGYFPRRGRLVEKLADGRDLVRCERGVNGANAYALTREGAQRLIDYSERIVHPVDNAMDRPFEHHLQLLVVRPFVVHHDDGGASTIRPTTGRTPPEPSPWTERLARRARRFGESLQRRWYHLRRYGLL